VLLTQQHTPARLSIVNGQIAATIRGEFGDFRFTERARGSELFVNPLMAMYFTVDLAGLARRLLYLYEPAATDTQYEVRAVIGRRVPVCAVGAVRGLPSGGPPLAALVPRPGPGRGR
jgi:hypothetical protein